MFSGVFMAVEQRPYEVISSQGNIELRYYSVIDAAEVIVSGSRRSAANRAFRLLFKYISGENEFNQKISMTAPVAQVATGENSWKVSFFMPQGLLGTTLPKAMDEVIKVNRHSAVKVASIQFSGLGRQDNLDKHEKQLKDHLAKSKLKYDTKPIYAFYNPPYVPWFLRRNEVMFVLID